MSIEWIVQLEMQRGDETELDDDFLERLVQGLADCSPRVLCSFDRYALLVCVAARTPLEAHLVALTRWEEVVRELTAPQWVPVRAEVVTQEEFDRECLLANDNDTMLVGFDRAASRNGAEALLREVFEDAATHLPTAAAFRTHVQRALTRRQRPTCQHAILVMDVHPADGQSGKDGDDLLLDAVERLGTVTRTADTLARVGPTALALLVEDVPDHAAPAVVARRVLGAFANTAAVSIGIAVSCATSSDSDHLFAAAYDAARIARRAGGVHWALFRPGPPPPVEWNSELSSDVGCEGSSDE